MAVVNPENLNQQFRGLNSLPVLRQVGLLVGLAASVAIGVAVVMWARDPSYSVLFAGLADRDAAAVMQALEQSAIEYKLDHRTGTLMVPARQVHDARIRLATQGLPKTTGTGFELLEGDQGLGTSRLIETARYHRAIEGELARSIMSLSSVQSARVHLAIPKDSVFIRNRTKPSASVLVDLYSGRSLSEEQVAGIVHLVASSVPDLETEQVTVVDQKGRLLTGGRSDTAELGLRSDRLRYAQRLEEMYTQRIQDILAPIVGLSGVRAQVTADIDFNVVETTSEVYTPDPTSVRSEQIDENQRRADAVGGVPGALTNQPPEGGVIAEGEGVLADGTTPTPLSSSRRVTRNYELDRTISHTRVAPGTIRRLSVAVVVDHRLVEGELQPLPEEELQRINTLVREAVGFSAERGDSVNVLNVSFKAEEAAEQAVEAQAAPIWKEPFVWDIGRQVLGALGVLFLILFVLRPVLKSLAERGKGAPAMAQVAFPPGTVPPGLPQGEDRLSLSGGQPAALAAPGVGGSYEDQLGAARKMVGEDPKRVAQVVKTWVAADE
jgi:flagellar M-ring protein FliF